MRATRPPNKVRSGTRHNHLGTSTSVDTMEPHVRFISTEILTLFMLMCGGSCIYTTYIKQRNNFLLICLTIDFIYILYHSFKINLSSNH